MTEVELEHEQEATRIVDEAKTEDGQAKDEADVKEEAEEEGKGQINRRGSQEPRRVREAKLYKFYPSDSLSPKRELQEFIQGLGSSISLRQPSANPRPLEEIWVFERMGSRSGELGSPKRDKVVQPLFHVRSGFGMCLVGVMGEEFVMGGPHAKCEQFSSPEGVHSRKGGYACPGPSEEFI
ncbi:hypothetical protein DEO72_LG2g3609 [Vigna unguiculata]|uniref:Uncharacterized protein n=1 Tax=Vigna unguiculata TaxID=3917 RepID=A0A4D6L450_VIGUN|nr:hypothetical protein DEO72_LG2g3609 [Vigna unguiculata]